jgi:hypothetical protein
MRREAGDGHKFLALFERLYECGCQRRAQGLVYVACIFTREELASTLAAMTVGSKLAWLLFADDGGVGQRGIIHNPVRVHLLLQRITLPRYVIVHPILAKTTSRPALHRVCVCVLSSGYGGSVLITRYQSLDLSAR